MVWPKKYMAIYTYLVTMNVLSLNLIKVKSSYHYQTLAWWNVCWTSSLLSWGNTLISVSYFWQAIYVGGLLHNICQYWRRSTSRMVIASVSNACNFLISLTVSSFYGQIHFLSCSPLIIHLFAVRRGQLDINCFQVTANWEMTARYPGCRSKQGQLGRSKTLIDLIDVSWSRVAY